MSLLLLLVLTAGGLLWGLNLVLRMRGHVLTWRILRWRLLTAIMLGTPLIVLIAMFRPPKAPSPFDANKWKSGNRWSRGAMVEDLTRNHVLIGKSRSEVYGLLGPPDTCTIPAPNSPSRSANASCTDPRIDWFGYEVVTIPRCNYFWVCRMGVVLNQTSYRVEDVNVSD